LSTIEIPLTQGFVAVIDEADWPLVKEHKWSVAVRPEAHSVRHYAQTFIGRTIVLMHRLLLDAQPGVNVDHEDGDGLNNRRTNIRLATTSQNGANNCRKRAHSGYRGVHPNKQRWMARVGRTHIGTFDTPVEAALARDEAMRERFGGFGRYNFPQANERAA
jgi:hypothetical protein